MEEIKEEVIKEITIGDTKIVFYTTYITVDIGVTDSSILDRLIYSYKDCYGLHSNDIVTMAWEDHNNLMEEFWEDTWDLD